MPDRPTFLIVTLVLSLLMPLRVMSIDVISFNGTNLVANLPAYGTDGSEHIVKVTLNVQSLSLAYISSYAIKSDFKENASARPPVQLFLTEETIAEVVNLFDESLADIVRSKITPLISKSYSLAYNRTVNNFFIPYNIDVDLINSSVKQIVYSSVPEPKTNISLQYYPDKRYSPAFFTPANIKDVTVYVPVGQKEKFMALMFYAEFKDVIECDPEEKWAELTAGGN